jgi:hypothetical protein
MSSLISNKSGQLNTAVGVNSLFSNTTGSYNTAIGVSSLFTNTTGYSNTAVGYESLKSNIVENNTAIGYRSLINNSSGYNTTAIGLDSGLNNTTGAFNTFLGAATDISNNGTTQYSNSTAIGYNSKITANNQIVLGRATETVYIPGTLSVSGNLSISAILGDITVTGNVTATAFITSSDYRIKENVVKLDDSYVIDNLNPVTYKNIKTDTQDIGLIAHELQEIFPDLVKGTKDGEELQSINYTGLIPILIKEIKDLKQNMSVILDKLNYLESCIKK